MKRIIIIWSLLAALLACHYSCFNCTSTQYTTCLSCPASPLTVVQDPSVIPQQYWSSVYPIGTCVDTLGGKANPLGIVLFILLSAFLLIGGSKEILYLYLTIQTWGLYNLVEIAWINPIGYLLQGLQYFMIWNVLGSGYKSTDYTLLTNKFYRLNLYMQQTGLAQNIALIAAFTLLSIVLLVIIIVIAVRRKKQAQVKEQLANKSSQREQQYGEKKWTCMEWLTEKVLIEVSKLLLVVLFLMAQETSLVLLVSLVFNLSAGAVIVSIIYLHILVFVMSYAYFYRVQYFKDKKVMYINFAKKVILPIMVVVPLKYHYLLFLFAGVAIFIEFLFDWYNRFYERFTRLAFYKVLEVLIYILLLTFYLVESSGLGFSSSKAAAIACTFAISFFIFIFVAVEVPLAIKERFFSDKSSTKDRNLGLQNQTEEIFIEFKQKDQNQLPVVQTMEVLQMENSNNRSSKDHENHENHDNHDNYENHEGQEEQEREEPQQDKFQDNTDTIFSIPREDPKPAAETAKKKRRKQILDKELRMRYGI